jgi:hypothetical protein
VVQQPVEYVDGGGVLRQERRPSSNEQCERTQGATLVGGDEPEQQLGAFGVQPGDCRFRRVTVC